MHGVALGATGGSFGGHSNAVAGGRGKCKPGEARRVLSKLSRRSRGRHKEVIKLLLGAGAKAPSEQDAAAALCGGLVLRRMLFDTYIQLGIVFAPQKLQ